ncbi:hypothetical protein IEQ34_022085 [Dendrobium chrysotoxum]|uniref:Uncharacterized protein n=1 Tax=Dendrobium chrysotoxum TaxID=161865 RepID=A0AAV7FWH7_DENCH|nr:hypothetical protein IEQ34_022085 [Dendrobium chrysotoxum]
MNVEIAWAKFVIIFKEWFELKDELRHPPRSQEFLDLVKTEMSRKKTSEESYGSFGKKKISFVSKDQVLCLHQEGQKGFQSITQIQLQFPLLDQGYKVYFTLLSAKLITS